jgi:hypothetical protein
LLIPIFADAFKKGDTCYRIGDRHRTFCPDIVFGKVFAYFAFVACFNLLPNTRLMEFLPRRANSSLL